MTAWYEIAKPGDKIVCIDNSNPGRAWPTCEAAGCVYPEERKIYTIRQIGHSALKGHWCLRLVEIVNPSVDFPPFLPGEPTFHVRRFRPLVKRKTDISIFQRMLTPASGVPVDA